MGMVMSFLLNLEPFLFSRTTRAAEWCELSALNYVHHEQSAHVQNQSFLLISCQRISMLRQGLQTYQECTPGSLEMRR